MTEPTLNEIKSAIADNKRLLTELLNRSARTETRLTQLMIFEGMQSDGRTTIQPRSQAHVG